MKLLLPNSKKARFFLGYLCGLSTAWLLMSCGYFVSNFLTCQNHDADILSYTPNETKILLFQLCKKQFKNYTNQIKRNMLKDSFIHKKYFNLTGNFSDLLYDPDDNITIAAEVAKQIPLVCYILTAPKYHYSRAMHVKLTWGRRCDRLYFFSTTQDSILNTVAVNVTENYLELWAKSMAAVQYLHAHMESQDQWFYKADDDTYAVIENLRYALLSFNSSELIMIGNLFRPGNRSKGKYVNGGAGYILSRASLQLLATEGHKCYPTNKTGYEDILLSRCIRKLKGRLVDALDGQNRERFFQIHPQRLLSPAGLMGTDSEFHLERLYTMPEKGMNCCSTTAISFHHLTPRTLYMMEYFLYFLRPFGIIRKFDFGQF